MSIRAIKILLIVVSGCFVAAIAYTSALIVNRQEALREVSRYNISWLVGQSVAEFIRLQQRITAHGQPGTGVDKDEVTLRFDIFVNRLRLLSNGEIQEFMRRDPERLAVMKRLSDAVVRVEPVILNIERPGAPQEALGILQPLDQQLVGLSSAAHRFGADRVAEDQAELLRLHWVFSGLAGGLALFGLSLIGFLGWQNRVLERAHEAISRQHTRFDAAINNMPHGLAMFDSAGRLTVGNRRLPAVLGLAEGLLAPGATLSEIETWARTERREEEARALGGLAAILRSKADGSSLLELADKRSLAVSQSVMPDGGSVCILEDVTARIQAHAKRQELEEQLRQSQKMEAVGKLTGGIAHDFNNLLTVILGNAELLVEDSSDPTLTEALSSMILEAAERGADLTQKLLTFGRRQSLKPERLHLADVVNSISPLLQRAIGEHIELRSEFAESACATLADRALLESALLNLVVNARDAMPQGGSVTIRVGERVAGIGEGALAEGSPVVFVTVSDTGTGMPPDVQARAFEPFFTTKEAGKGSGLGLSMVYGFAEQSGGHVAIRSSVGDGTSIAIVLPACEGEGRAEAAEAAPKAPASVKRERVLIVEDEPQVLQFASSQLRGLGYDVTAVATGAEALMLIETGSRFDLLFTDLVLPKGMSGIEVARKAQDLNPDLGVVLASGYSEEIFEQHGRPAGDTEMLHKPYKRAELADAVRRALDRRQPVAEASALRRAS